MSGTIMDCGKCGEYPCVCRCQRFRDEIIGLNAVVTNKEAELAALRATVSTLTAEVERLKRDLCMTEAERDAAREQLAEARRDNEKLKDLLSAESTPGDVVLREADLADQLAEAVRVIEPVKREADNREDYMHPSWNDDAHIELTLTVRECRAAAAFLARSGGGE